MRDTKVCLLVVCYVYDEDFGDVVWYEYGGGSGDVVWYEYGGGGGDVVAPPTW